MNYAFYNIVTILFLPDVFLSVIIKIYFTCATVDSFIYFKFIKQTFFLIKIKRNVFLFRSSYNSSGGRSYSGGGRKF